MSKGLEALERIKNWELFIDFEIDTNGMEEFGEEIKIIEKELKAFDIIKQKQVNVKCIMSGWGLGKYNSYKSHEKLTEEEYDLLREVLL